MTARPIPLLLSLVLSSSFLACATGEFAYDHDGDGAFDNTGEDCNPEDASIYLASSGNVEMRGRNFADNVGTSGPVLYEWGGTGVASDNNFWNNTAGDMFGFGSSTSLYVDPEWLQDDNQFFGMDLHLSLTSPLIGAGYRDDPDGGAGDVGHFGGDYAATWDLDHDGYNPWWQPGDYDPGLYPDKDCWDTSASLYPGNGC